MGYLREKFGQTEESAFAWSRHWIETGFDAYEASIATDRKTGAFSHGDQPTLADLCLVPQVFNAQRFKVDMATLPDHPAHLCHLHEASGLRRRPARQAAGRRTVRKGFVAAARRRSCSPGAVVAAVPIVQDHAAAGIKSGDRARRHRPRSASVEVGPVRPPHHAARSQDPRRRRRTRRQALGGVGPCLAARRTAARAHAAGGLPLGRPAAGRSGRAAGRASRRS